MNSLDWINDRIEVIKKQIKKLKNMIKSYSEKLSDSDNDTQVVSFLCRSEAEDKLQECEYILKIYQQIKTELEAWYVVKPSINLRNNKELKNWVYLSSYNYSDEKYNKLKKALEVQDE